jgi:hypothetical protein
MSLFHFPATMDSVVDVPKAAAYFMYVWMYVLIKVWVIYVWNFIYVMFACTKYAYMYVRFHIYVWSCIEVGQRNSLKRSGAN